jgi:hypothetical protein
MFDCSMRVFVLAVPTFLFIDVIAQPHIAIMAERLARDTRTRREMRLSLYEEAKRSNR